MALAQTVLGCLIYAVVWLLLLRNSWPWLPLGRAMSAVTGAAAMVVFGVISPAAAFASVNLPTLGLLTGCMLVSAHMDEQGLYTRLSASLSAAGSPLLFLLRVSAVSAVSSAFITNDTACVILTRIVGRAAASRRLHPAPFLLALAVCANVGSACSAIGNPQNMLIALNSGLSFMQFIQFNLAAAVAATAVSVATIVFVYRRALLGGQPELYNWSDVQLQALGVAVQRQEHNDGVLLPSNAGAAINVEPLTLDPNACATVTEPDSTVNVEAATPAPAATGGGGYSPLRRRCILALLALFPVALLVADRFIGLAWVALTTSTLLAIVAGRDPAPFLARVDATLLLFFAALFIVVDAFNATGVPEHLWAAIAPAVSVSAAPGLALFTLVVLVASNVVSNVPLVLLLSPKLRDYTGLDANAAWAQLAFISTSAGNLTLMGSVANLIVAEQAKDFYTLTAGEYARVGVPSTLLSCLVGVPLVKLCVGN